MKKPKDKFEVLHNFEKLLFEVHVDGHMAELVYRMKGNKIYLMHTWVPQEIGGRGIAKSLAIYALSYGEKNELETIIYCPFIKAFLEKHPDWKNEFKR